MDQPQVLTRRRGENARGGIKWLGTRVALADGEHLLWIGPLQRNGYGTWGGVPAHRKVWQALVGPIPTGKELDHVKERCQIRHCVAPWHLEPVTHLENVQRRRRDVCPRGHPYGPAVPGVERRCGECNREWQRNHYHANKPSVQERS
jgi:hypothetical protein